MKGRGPWAFVLIAVGTWVSGVVLYSEYLQDGTSLLDWAYASSVLFVGSFTPSQATTPTNPGIPLQVVRLLAFGLSFSAALSVVWATSRRRLTVIFETGSRGKIVVVGNGTNADRLALCYLERPGGPGVVRVRWGSEWVPGRLHGVREISTDSLEELKGIVEGARRVVVLPDSDEMALRMASVLDAGIDRPDSVHVVFESPDVAGAMALAHSEDEGDAPAVDLFSGTDRVVSTCLFPASRSLAARLLIVGDGELAELVAVRALDGFSVMDTTEVVCIGSRSSEITDAVRLRRPHAAIRAVTPDGGPIVTAVHGELENGGPAMIVACGVDDASSIATASAVARFVGPSSTSVDRVVALCRAADFGRASQFLGVAVVSVHDELGNPEVVERELAVAAAQWTEPLELEPIDTMRRVCGLLIELGYALIPGAPPCVLSPGDLIAIEALLVRDLGLSPCEMRSVPSGLDRLSWAAQVPLWLARAGVGTVPTRPRQPLMTLDEIESAASEIHKNYWDGLTPAEQATKPAQGVMANYSELTEHYRVANRAQAWHYPVFAAALGFDFVGYDKARTPEFSTDVVDELARFEHIRWARERTGNGWRPGERSEVLKQHPDLKDWDELGETEKDKDRSAIRNMTEVLTSLKIGLESAPIRSLPAAVRALADAPRYESSVRVHAHKITEPTEWTTERGSKLCAPAGSWMLTDDDGRQWSILDKRFRDAYRKESDGQYVKVNSVNAVTVGKQLDVATPEGDARADPGDWLVCDVDEPDSIVWPVTGQRFSECYRQVDESA